MNNPNTATRQTAREGQPARPTRRAFTLVELLVIISIIVALLGLIMAVGPAVNRKKILSRLAVDKSAILVAIEAYQSEQGFYPPDNTNNTAQPPLYYELKGTTNNPTGTQFQARGDGNVLASATLNQYFNVSGFINASPSGGKDYFPNIPASMAEVIPTTKLKRLVGRVADESGNMTPWRYDCSTTNRHNEETFDLWLTAKIGRKTYTISNWED